jgi:periplasmic protein TonB
VLVIALLGIGAMRSGPPLKPSGALIVNLVPESSGSPSEAKKAEAPKKATQVSPPRPRLPHVLPIKPPIQVEHPLDLIPMTKAELAAADITRLPKASTRSGSGGSGDSEAVGRGPNGEVLYAAEWARKPTDAELRGYLPPNAPDGYGLIACRTIPQNRVEDCIEIGQSPRGSHLASAVRQAAWQFRVRPPRKNGKELIGEWVQIQIEYQTVRRQ